jgi:acetoin utilization protein AcuB
MIHATIADHMTECPLTIGKDQPLSVAHRLMREHRIRHLPVLHMGSLVGIVTDRDLRLVETLADVDPDQATIEEAMTPDPYAAAPETPLEEVVAVMCEHKYGSAVVVDRGRVVGVFTVIDALVALRNLLAGQPSGRDRPSGTARPVSA